MDKKVEFSYRENGKYDYQRLELFYRFTKSVEKRNYKRLMNQLVLFDYGL